MTAQEYAQETAQRESAPREYRTALGEAEAALERDRRADRVVAAVRLQIVLLGLVAAWLAVQNGLFSPLWLLAPLFAFALALVGHERLRRRLGRSLQRAAYYRQGLARLARGAGDPADDEAGARTAGDEAGPGAGNDAAPPARYLPPAPRDHPYAEDLNVLGRGSLFERLSLAQTRAGSDVLAGWLLAPAATEEILARQAAIAELRQRGALREQLFVLLAESESAVDRQGLAAWARSPASLPLNALRLTLPVLALANLSALVAYLLGSVPAAIPLLVFTCDAGVFAFLRPRLQAVLLGVERRGRDLAQLESLLALLEREPARAPWLAERLGVLARAGAESPARVLGRLRRLVDWAEARRNAFFAPLGALVWWATQFACAIERLRLRHGAAIEQWLARLAELEALSSLATWSFEQPDNPFPVLVTDGPPLLMGSELRHPLLPRAWCVPNDITLGAAPGEAPRGYVVSGSNLSGKSTYLRTIGTNVVLALAGAPVCARSLRLCPFQVTASLRVADSLQEGQSRFSAEIARLRQILELCEGPRPVLFLLDEVLSGTNSHDRRIGAEGIVRALLERRAIGLLTTHDLALAHLADGGLPLRNVHFEDHLEGGAMRFDYRLRPGVVTRSNALALMRAVGLPV